MEESYSTLLHMLGHTLSPFRYIKFASLTLHLLWKNSSYFIVSTLMIYGHYFFISECLFKLLKFQYFSHTDTLYFLQFLIFFFSRKSISYRYQPYWGNTVLAIKPMLVLLQNVPEKILGCTSLFQLYRLVLVSIWRFRWYNKKLKNIIKKIFYLV